MDGPYTIEEAHIVFGSHFWTCPLGLVEKPGSSALRMIRHFSKTDQFGDSTNSWVNSDDFPTRWFSAAQTADFVCFVHPNFALNPSTLSTHARSSHGMFSISLVYPSLEAVEALSFLHSHIQAFPLGSSELWMPVCSQSGSYRGDSFEFRKLI